MTWILNNFPATITTSYPGKTIFSIQIKKTHFKNCTPTDIAIIPNTRNMVITPKLDLSSNIIALFSIQHDIQDRTFYL